jgi:ribosomal-protein-alanine N-acetyltransferase
MGTDKDVRVNEYKISLQNQSIIIRKCTVEDLEGVIEVNERELPEDYPYFFYKSILDSYGESFLVACNTDGKIIGYIMWRVEKLPSRYGFDMENKGHLVSLAVTKEYRRLGIASALLVKSMKKIKKHDIDEYVLEVRVTNFNAINLYKKFKFSTHSIKYKYYRDGENAYFMKKEVEE